MSMKSGVIVLVLLLAPTVAFAAAPLKDDTGPTVTFISEGDVKVTGGNTISAPDLAADPTNPSGTGIFVVAGGDFEMAGNANFGYHCLSEVETITQGLIFAHEEVKGTGTADIYGAVVEEDASKSADKMGMGNATVIYGGGLSDGGMFNQKVPPVPVTDKTKWVWERTLGSGAVLSRRRVTSAQ